MSYNTLVAPKGVAGSITDWVGYGKISVQADTILTEVQALIYQALRVREMRSQYVFGVPVGNCRVALPARFLDPIGKLRDTTFGGRYRHLTESDVTDRRYYQPVSGGSFGNNPFTTGTLNSGQVAAVLAAHGLTQGSDITIAGATSPIDGVGVNGTFLLTDASDPNALAFLTYDNATVGGVNGGGAAATWSANKLIAGTPTCWAIWDEYLQFDQAFDTATQFRLMCFKAPAPLSTLNPTNFLTTRYPQLLRVATQLWAASFMKDDNEKQKSASDLGALIQATNAESDLMYRGAELDTDTP
ncbi:MULTISPECIES: hypothetical protein [unclassified Bradyrhizobium]|uniref:hypothetical protein n=1 Tax=unclassified Bradyrhizobium TaxID=2631580 RepID=UPI003399D4E7